MNRAVRTALWIGAAGVLVALAAVMGFVLAAGSLGAAGYEDERAKIVKERRALEEDLVKARVLFDNLALYQKDRATLAAAAAKRGLTTPEAEVLARLRGEPTMRIEQTAAADGSLKVLTISMQGDVGQWLDLVRRAVEAKLVLRSAGFAEGRAQVEALLLPRVVLGDRPPVVRKGEVRKVPEGSGPSLFDLTRVAYEREVLERTRKELEALEEAAPGLLVMLRSDLAELKGTEQKVQRWDEGQKSSLSVADFEQVDALLRSLKSASLKASLEGFVLEGVPAQGLTASAIESLIQRTLPGAAVPEPGAPIRIAVKRGEAARRPAP